MGGGACVVRTTGDASLLLPLINDAVHALDPKVLVVHPRTLRDVLSNIVRRQNVAMTLTGAGEEQGSKSPVLCTPRRADARRGPCRPNQQPSRG
jgi:hypothetical protein